MIDIFRNFAFLLILIGIGLFGMGGMTRNKPEDASFWLFAIGTICLMCGVARVFIPIVLDETSLVTAGSYEENNFENFMNVLVSAVIGFAILIIIFSIAVTWKRRSENKCECLGEPGCTCDPNQK